MAHEPRQTTALRNLLNTQRVAALGTQASDGHVFVSMVPFALEPDQGWLVIHVSALAAHTQNMQKTPEISLMVMQAEVAGEPVHALPRVTLQGKAVMLERESPEWNRARAAYLLRFPEAAPMTDLGDFRFVGIAPEGARQISGFGAARSMDAAELVQVLRQST